MADYRETIRTPSQNIVSTQNGRIFIDEAQGRMVINDGTRNVLVTDQTGTSMFDENGNNPLKFGVMPDGSYGFVIVKPGNNVDDVFN